MTGTVKMEVSKTVQGANGAANTREKIGEVVLYVPSLKEFGVDIEPVGSEEDGSLKYAANEHNWLYSAVLAATKARARNLLKNGSVELKAGAKLAETLVELVTPSETTNTVLAERRAIIALFGEWLAKLDKPVNLKNLLKIFMDKPDTLLAQPKDKRDKIKVFFTTFGEAVEATLTDYQANYLDNILSLCDEDEVSFD